MSYFSNCYQFGVRDIPGGIPFTVLKNMTRRSDKVLDVQWLHFSAAFTVVENVIPLLRIIEQVSQYAPIAVSHARTVHVADAEAMTV